MCHIFTTNDTLENARLFVYNEYRKKTKGDINMISKEQEQFVRNYISTEYFDPDKVVSYLKIHDKVGAEIFDLSLKEQHKRNIRLVGDRVGFDTIDSETFIRRVPFYFYEPDFDKDEHGHLLYFFYGRDNYEERKDIERVYTVLEKLFYQYNISVPDIMGYTIKTSGLYGRNDIFFKWVHYLELCKQLRIDNRFPDNFLYEYNRILELAGLSSIIYEPGLVGYNEDFLRRDREIIIGGEFPCNEHNEPVLKWIGVWIENAAYVKAEACYGMGNTSKELEKELHIGLTPDTKIYMPNIYNSDDNHDVWYPIYSGSRVMSFDSEALKYYRNRMNATQQEVANAIGVQIRTYQKWEKGDTIPDGYNLIRLMNYLNIESVQDFVDNSPFIDDDFAAFRNRNTYN